MFQFLQNNGSSWNDESGFKQIQLWHGLSWPFQCAISQTAYCDFTWKSHMTVVPELSSIMYNAIVLYNAEWVNQYQTLKSNDLLGHIWAPYTVVLHHPVLFFLYISGRENTLHKVSSCLDPYVLNVPFLLWPQGQSQKCRWFKWCIILPWNMTTLSQGGLFSKNTILYLTAT